MRNKMFDFERSGKIKNHWLSLDGYALTDRFFYLIFLIFTYRNNKIEQCEDVWTYTLFTKLQKRFHTKKMWKCECVYSQTVFFVLYAYWLLTSMGGKKMRKKNKIKILLLLVILIFFIYILLCFLINSLLGY